MLATLAAQSVCPKIGRTRAGPGGRLGLLRYVGVLGRQWETVCNDELKSLQNAAAGLEMRKTDAGLAVVDTTIGGPKVP